MEMGMTNKAKREWAINRRTPTLVYDAISHEAICTTARTDLAEIGFQEPTCSAKEQADRARLIAAAPDLLAALQELLKDDGAVNCGIGNGGPLMQREYIAAARAAKDAITRATTP